MAGISVGSVMVSVLPDAARFTTELRGQLVPAADTLGVDMGERISAGINSALSNVGLDVAANTTAADMALAETKAMAENLGQSSPTITPEVNTAEAVAKLTALAAASDKAADAAKYAYAAQQVQAAAQASVGSTASQAALALTALAAAAESSGGSAQRAYGAWGLLTKEVTLWGGLFGDTELIGKVALWHVAMDGLIETFALWVPALATAAIELGALGVYAAPSLLAIYKQMDAIHTVSVATGQTIPPLTGSFQKLADQVRPEVYEAFGEALDAMNSKSGAFNQTILGTGNLLDRWGAELVVHLQQGGDGLQNFLHTGQEDLALIGQGLESVAVIGDNLLKATALTHAAEDLTEVGDAALKVAAAISSMPTPVLAAVLGLHGLVLWGGLAATGIQKVGLGVTGLVGKLPGMSDAALSIANGFGASSEKLGEFAAKTNAVKLAAAALETDAASMGQFAIQAEKGGQSIADLAAATDVGAIRMSYFGSGLNDTGKSAVNLAIAAGATEGQLATLAETAEKGASKTGAWSSVLAKLSDVPVWGWVGLGVVALTALGIELASVKDATTQWVDALNDSLAKDTWFNTLPSNMEAIREVNVRLAGTQNDLSDSMTRSAGAVNATQIRLGGYNSAAESAQVVTGGLKQSISELQAEQTKLTTTQTAQIGFLAGLSRSYGTDLVGSEGLAAEAGVKLSQVTQEGSKAFQAAQEQVAALVDGYKAMGQQGGTLGQDIDVLNYAASSQVKEMGDLNKAWDTFTKNVAAPAASFVTLAQGFSSFATDAKAAGASMTGLSDPALKLQSDFQGSYTQAEQLFDALRTAGAPAATFTSTVKDLVASMLPMTGGSKEAVAQLSALAQEANGPATTSVKTLQTWVGNIHDPLKAMQQASNNVAIALSNVSQDAAKLATTLQSDLNSEMAAAILQANGSQKAFNTFATAVLHNKNNLDADQASAGSLASKLITLTGNTSQAQEEFVTMASKLGLTTGQANTLWASASRLANEFTVSHPARQTMITDLTNIGLKSTIAKTDVDQFNTMIQQNGGKITAAQAARSALINDIIKSGTAAHDTTGQIATMITKISGIPKSEALNIVETAEGSYKISESTDPIAKNSLQSALVAGTKFGHAAGWLVPGYGGGDRWPALLEGGETVVPKHLTPAVAPLMAAHGVPGFETGTYAGNGGAGTFPGLGDLAVKGHTAMVNDTAQALVSAMNSAIKSAQTAASSAGGSVNVAGGPGGTNAQNQALGQKMAAEIGWTGAQWTALNQLVMMESGWSSTIKNPTSSASGIAQNISGFSSSYQSGNATQQINWLLSYIKGRYGTPEAALQHELSNNPHWYDTGGWMPPGLSLSLNGTGRPEPVFTGRQWDMLSSAVAGGGGGGLGGTAVLKELRGIRDATEKAPARTGGHVSQALNGTARGAVQRAYSRTR